MFTDKLSGSAKMDRPGLLAMLDYARAGDTVVVTARRICISALSGRPIISTPPPPPGCTSPTAAHPPRPPR